MERPHRRPNSREEILDAAEAVVGSLGAANLTLDAVADRAGISKGGLLYNFPSKEALLKAMIDRLLERSNAYRQEARQTQVAPDDPAADLKAYILAAFRQSGEREPVCGALLAAGASDPRLLTPVRDRHEALFRDLSAGKRYPLRVLVVMLAMDGLWLNELLNTSPHLAPARQALQEELLAFAAAAV